MCSNMLEQKGFQSRTNRNVVFTATNGAWNSPMDNILSLNKTQAGLGRLRNVSAQYAHFFLQLKQ
jgi:hypothetical protein